MQFPNRPDSFSDIAWQDLLLFGHCRCCRLRERREPFAVFLLLPAFPALAGFANGSRFPVVALRKESALPAGFADRSQALAEPPGARSGIAPYSNSAPPAASSSGPAPCAAAPVSPAAVSTPPRH